VGATEKRGLMGSSVVAVACSYEPFELPGFGMLPHHAVYERYLDGLLELLDVSPILIPCVGRAHGVGAAAFAADCVSIVDGLLLPGGSSNIAPELYGGAPQAGGERDPDRDATVIPLVRAALRAGVPILGICRGMQELNVAVGGTLCRAVHELPGRRDHRSRRDRPFGERYGPAHPLRVAPGSWMERELLAAGLELDDLMVNSLHGQGVDRLGRRVVVEATADDGTIEAIRVEDAAALALGVQWHLEWHAATPLHASLLRAFGRACEQRRLARMAAGMKEEG
jgi:putative glutamine amidotransferase